MAILTNEEFLRYLRGALSHLYDPDYLRTSPLAALFGLGNRPDAPSVLQRLLIDTIETLKPVGEPHHSPGRRTYQLLLFRYVQQFSQEEVANQLGLSTRHLRRTQYAALQDLASHLWEHFHLGDRALEVVDTSIGGEGLQANTLNANEFAWLGESSAAKPTDPLTALKTVTELAQPLAAHHGVRLNLLTADELPVVDIDPIALRQILLNLISQAIERSADGAVEIAAGSLGEKVEIRVGCRVTAESPEHSKEDAQASLEIAQQLASLFDGRLSVHASPRAFSALLTLPAFGHLTVLVVDDNADILQLMRRYTSGTRYRLLGTRDPEQAVEIADRVSPQMIILDVMMPQTDGWEILGRLKRHPHTERIPVIVCTILAQEELALSLGASRFVRKPVTRESLLAALDREAEFLGLESH